MIYLVAAPFAMISYPHLAAPLLSSILKEGGLPVRTIYLNFDLAKMMGALKYENLAGSRDRQSLREWLFSDALWGKGKSEEEDAAFLNLEAGDLDDDEKARMLDMKYSVVPRFMAGVMERFETMPDVSVVGFSCLFQLLPPLAIGRMIKEAHPAVKLIYGGSAFHGQIGEELFDKLDWIDAVSNSEADDVALEAFTRISEGRPIDGLQGMMYRDRRNGAVYKTEGRQVSPEDMNRAPYPDFDDYFESLRQNYGTDLGPLAGKLLPFEGSRGCWWFERSRCRFCGLNGISKSFRVKDPIKVAETLKHYKNRYGVKYFAASDNVMPNEFLDSFLPRLRALNQPGGAESEHRPYNVFYEVKTTFSREQVKRLAESGVVLVQAGIESLSDNLLKQMNKGVSAIQNIFFLKCARQYGLFVIWYVLMKMYGETQEDYDEMAALAPYLAHFSPPSMSRSFIKCHRYSAYHNDSERYFEKIAPAAFYSALFPDFFDLDKLAYTFDVKWRGVPDATERYDALSKWLERWRELWVSRTIPAFFMRDTGDGCLSLFDSRDGTTETKIDLDSDESKIYGMLDDITAMNSILDRSSEFCPPHRTEVILASFVEYGFAVRFDNLFLGLANREGFKQWPLDERLLMTNS
ncbi:MAG: RiPP maturation radical SAM C-methyltransferase [Synergistaceae bacterium]|nr:RiPP maturation radical SAM C-methyltransferase [Synergistaceae bacterium]